ncbi:hypothetical protein PV327_002715 [Microctonus hyperodae]|uniref:Nucleolar protein 6 n=1 Tax=Microctonus hyperodae TaxID=165561 RepID=A0AA39FG52_MICHY|nr:hypothetical protein PV327_002715 [Microctonus hyperodae]
MFDTKNMENDDEDSEIITKNQKRILEDDGDTVKPKKKKIRKENDLYKQPTVEELNQLRETENLYHSNLFRLQIEEILNEVKLKEKYKKHFKQWFSTFKQKIESIEETEEKQLSDLEPLKELGVIVPELNVSINEKGSFKFLKPTRIDTIGSYCLGATIGPNIVIDIMIEMPSKLFHKHDYQNYRYMRKRAIYLSYIASCLNDDLVEKKTFIGESWIPILKIIPTGLLSKRVVVNVHLALEFGTFKYNRFVPEKNSVRSDWYFNEKIENDDKLIPTPLYNSNILRDLTIAEVNSRNIKMLAEYPNIRDGIILLKIWLRQRQIENSFDEFNGHILTMFVLFLLYEKKLNTYMSSYQIIRNVWNHLAMSNWNTAGITMCYESESKTRVGEYHKYYDCVFLDITGYHNLMANVTANNYFWIRSEAQHAVECLDNSNIDSFQVLFMRRLPLYSTFDHFICLRDTEALDKLTNKLVSKEKQLDLGVNKRLHFINYLVKILKEGLGQRVSHIYIPSKQMEEWEVSEKKINNIGRIFIGFQLNPDYCFSIIDKGPTANLPEAVAFRKFWQQKSELRRFQDGSICEALVWGTGKTISEKRMICKKIVMYLLKSKFNLSKDQYLYVGDQIDEFLHLKKTSITKFSYGTGEEATLQVHQVFNDLEKELTSLTDMPLSITGVQGSSSVFKYTEVFPPLATVYKADKKNTQSTKHCLILREDTIEEAPKYAPAIEVTLQLSASGKWPDELEAVRHTKAAFHLQIAQCLRKQYNLKAKANAKYIDVFKNGFAFRLIVAHQKEIALMKQEIDKDGVIKYRDNDESIELENKLFNLPKLTGAFHGLHSQQPTFGPTCCLAKCWLSAQLIDYSHMPEIVIELIVASMYLAPDPYKPAQTPQVGFLRLLEFFARERWSTDPVIVNFNNEMSREDIVSIENSFETKRETLPPLFISTPYDHDNSIWTKKVPTNLILNRVSSLAKEVLKLVETELLKDSILVWKPMFVPPMTAYDCLIYMKSEFNPRRYQYFDLDDSVPKTTWHPYKPHTEQKIPVIEFNPVQRYLDQLRHGYGEFALFFHDTYGGSVIGVLLNPNALIAKDFKVANMNCRKLDVNGKLVLNVPAMIEDFSNLGNGLIEKIDLKSEKYM